MPKYRVPITEILHYVHFITVDADDPDQAYSKARNLAHDEEIIVENLEGISMECDDEIEEIK